MHMLLTRHSAGRMTKDALKEPASRITRTEMIVGLVISGLMVVIACIVMHVLPQIPHAKLLF